MFIDEPVDQWVEQDAQCETDNAQPAERITKDHDLHVSDHDERRIADHPDHPYTVEGPEFRVACSVAGAVIAITTLLINNPRV